MNIYVGNFPYETTEEQLRELFGEFGQIEDISIITDRHTGRSRGFGFVTMPNDDEAGAAIDALNDKEVGERPLKVNQAKERDSRPRQSGYQRDRY